MKKYFLLLALHVLIPSILSASAHSSEEEQQPSEDQQVTSGFAEEFLRRNEGNIYSSAELKAALETFAAEFGLQTIVDLFATIKNHSKVKKIGKNFLIQVTKPLNLNIRKPSFHDSDYGGSTAF